MVDIKLRADKLADSLSPKLSESRPITEIAKDKTLPVMLRIKAINMLGASGSTNAVEVLEECLKDKNLVVDLFRNSIK